MTEFVSACDRALTVAGPSVWWWGAGCAANLIGSPANGPESAGGARPPDDPLTAIAGGHLLHRLGRGLS